MCQYSVFIYKTSAFVSEWCGALIGVYHVAVQWEHIFGRSAIETFMVLFWLISGAGHWFYVWTLAVTSPVPSPAVLEKLEATQTSEYEQDSPELIFTTPKPQPVCGPVAGMESTLRAINNFIEPSVGFFLPTGLLLVCFLEVLVHPYCCCSSLLNAHKPLSRRQRPRSEYKVLLSRSLLSNESVAPTSSHNIHGTFESNGASGNNSVLETAAATSSLVRMPDQMQMGLESNGQDLPRRASLVMLGSLIFTSLVLKSPFFVYRLYCEIVHSTVY